MLLGLAHTALRVPDLDAALAWYRDVLGLTVFWPGTLVEGEEIERDMGELVPAPVAVRAAILGVGDAGDRVLEVIEYPRAPGRPRPPDASIVDEGFTHVGLVCDDVAATREALEAKGVEFLTRGIADVTRLRTTWFRDPFGNVFILMEKSRSERPYYAQYGGRYAPRRDDAAPASG